MCITLTLEIAAMFTATDARRMLASPYAPNADYTSLSAVLDYAADALREDITKERGCEVEYPAHSTYNTGRRHGLELGLAYVEQVRKILNAFSEARAEMEAGVCK